MTKKELKELTKEVFEIYCLVSGLKERIEYLSDKLNNKFIDNFGEHELDKLFLNKTSRNNS